MAVTNIAIANAALTKIGGQHLTQWGEASKTGELIGECFERLRDAELQAARWCFALRRAVLPALAAAPSFGFARAFRLPVDYLGLVQIGEVDVTYLPLGPEYRTADVATWAIEGNALLTDEPAPLRLRYLARVTEPSLFHPLFDDVLANRIAIEICKALTGDHPPDRLERAYRFALSTARRQNAIEKHPAYAPDSAWLMSRVMS